MYIYNKKSNSNFYNNQNYIINDNIKIRIAYQKLISSSILIIFKLFFWKIFFNLISRYEGIKFFIYLHILIFFLTSPLLILSYFYFSNFFIISYLLLFLFYSISLVDFYRDYKFSVVEVLWFKNNNDFLYTDYYQRLIKTIKFDNKILYNNLKNFLVSLFFSFIFNLFVMYIYFYV